MIPIEIDTDWNIITRTIRTLLAFLQSTYAAAAELGTWDRASLEVPPEVLRAVGAA